MKQVSHPRKGSDQGDVLCLCRCAGAPGYQVSAPRQACQRDETSNVSHHFEEESPTTVTHRLSPFPPPILAEWSQLGKGINEKDENMLRE